LLEAFAKYSPAESGAAKGEENRLLAAFRGLDPAARERILQRLETPREPAGPLSIEAVEALESGPKKA
jgi:hypothetical protein